MTIPLLDLREQYRSIEEEILPELKELCASQHFILGEKVERFEHELAAYCGVPFACGVTSGSDALIISNCSSRSLLSSESENASNNMASLRKSGRLAS